MHSASRRKYLRMFILLKSSMKWRNKSQICRWWRIYICRNMWILFNILSAGEGVGGQLTRSLFPILKVLETKRVITVIPSYFALFCKRLEMFIILEHGYSVEVHSLRSWCWTWIFVQKGEGQLRISLVGINPPKKTKSRDSCLSRRSSIGMIGDMPEVKELVQVIRGHILCCCDKLSM